MDGALYHNNPIKIADREWKLIWSNELCEYPDVVLSLGTAFNPHARRVPVKKSSSVKLGVLSHGMSLMKIAKDHIEDSLDCEKTWCEYVSLLSANASSSRFVRYNIALTEDPPTLDDLHSMKRLQDYVRTQLSNDSFRLKKLAMQLMATSFYFETSRIQQFTENGATVSGRDNHT